MSNKYDLRPCPMCGSTDIKVYTTESVQSYRRGTVKCKKCGCMVRAEGGGSELCGELGFKSEQVGQYWHQYSTEAYEAARRESDKRARNRAINKWNGEPDELD